MSACDRRRGYGSGVTDSTVSDVCGKRTGRKLLRKIPFCCRVSGYCRILALESVPDIVNSQISSLRSTNVSFEPIVQSSAKCTDLISSLRYNSKSGTNWRVPWTKERSLIWNAMTRTGISMGLFSAGVRWPQELHDACAHFHCSFIALAMSPFRKY